MFDQESRRQTVSVGIERKRDKSKPLIRRWHRIGWALLATVTVACSGQFASDDSNGRNQSGGQALPSLPLTGAKLAETCNQTASMPLPQRVWMLTDPQFRATLAALTPQPEAPRYPLVDQQTFLGTDATMLRLTTAQIGELMKRVERTANFIAQSPEDYVDCNMTNAACRTRFVQTLIERAWRSDPEAETTSAMLELITLGETEADLETGLSLAATAILKSPRFLFRTEIGTPRSEGQYALDAWEIASQLSYGLWGAPPDASLVATIRSGDFQAPEGRNAILSQLLRDPRSSQVARRFVTHWSQADTLPSLSKDTSRFPAFDESVATGLLHEVERFAEHAFRSGGTLDELLRGGNTVIDRSIAHYYGLEPWSGNDQRTVSLDAQSRRGVLTLPGVMAAVAHADHISPTVRGRFILNEVLCDPMPPAPVLSAEVAEQAASLGARARLAYLAEQPACASCHLRADPIGFAFERFNAVGAYETTDTAGTPIDTSGHWEVSGGERQSFDGALSFVDSLAGSEHTLNCFTVKLYEHLYGRQATNLDACTLLEASNQFEDSGQAIHSLLQALLAHPNAQLRSPSK